MRNFRESGFRIILPENAEQQCVSPIVSFRHQLHPMHHFVVLARRSSRIQSSISFLFLDPRFCIFFRALLRCLASFFYSSLPTGGCISQTVIVSNWGQRPNPHSSSIGFLGSLCSASFRFLCDFSASVSARPRWTILPLIPSPLLNHVFRLVQLIWIKIQLFNSNLNYAINV